MPNSCTNVLGVPEFPRIIGDSQREGTRIKSSAMSSIFTWNDQQCVRHFKHPASHLPEMTVNDGFSTLQKFCNVIAKIVPDETQCHHLNRKTRANLKPTSSEAIFCPYEVGEEILFKNADHLEAGVIESIVNDNEKNKPNF